MPLSIRHHWQPWPMHTCSSLIFCCRRANECGVGRKAPSIDPCRRLFRESLGDKIGHSSKLTKWQGIDADVQTQRVFRLKPETRKCGRKVHYCLPDAINSGTKISLIHKSMQKLFLRHKNGKCLQKNLCWTYATFHEKKRQKNDTNFLVLQVQNFIP